MIKLYTDAATKGNPGPSGLGALVVAHQQQFQLHQSAGVLSNHAGEFAAAQFGFAYLLDHFAPTEAVYFYTDSRLLADALQKNYAKHFAPELAALQRQMAQFNLVISQWIPEKQNHGAHHLATQALHEALAVH